MASSSFFGYPDYASYRAAFRASAQRRGIDPETGITIYQIVLEKADARRRSHFKRMAQAVYADAAREGAWQRYDNGYGLRDVQTVERQARADWWRFDGYWKGRCAETTNITFAAVVLRLHGMILPPDVEALYNMRQAIREGENVRHELLN